MRTRWPRLSCRSPKLAAFVVQNGPPDRFVAFGDRSSLRNPNRNIALLAQNGHFGAFAVAAQAQIHRGAVLGSVANGKIADADLFQKFWQQGIVKPYLAPLV